MKQPGMNGLTLKGEAAAREYCRKRRLMPIIAL
jgi:hypothetical protein